MLNSLDPDQARHKVGPDLGPNCMQILLADDTKIKALKELNIHTHVCAKILFNEEQHQSIKHFGSRSGPTLYRVRPDVGRNCFQRLSADNTSRQKVKKFRPVQDTLVLISSVQNRGSLFDLILYIPVNNFSVTSGWVFLG